jgi:two-component system cell cycle sensor histidine kinase/response regulator CckA
MLTLQATMLTGPHWSMGGDMKDKDKTKGQLIGELTEMRQRIAELGVVETGRKRAEEVLRLSEEHYRALVENINDVIFSLDTQGCFTYISSAIERIALYKVNEVIGQPFVCFVHSDDLAGLRASFERTLTGKLEPYEFRAIAKDGAVLHVRTFSRPLWEDGQLVGVAGVMIDITERKRAEAALREAHAELGWRVEERTAELSQANASLKAEIAERKRAEDELRRVNRMLKIFCECNQVLLRATEEIELLNEICRLIVDLGGYPLVWVGFAEQNADKTVRPVAQKGFEEGYLNTVNITWADTERGWGPTGSAIRTGEPCIAQDIQTDPNFALWREEATRRGYASSIALPLCGDDRVFGALNIYATEPSAFHAEEVHLLMELAGNLAYGITSLRSRAERKRAEEAVEESEARYRAIVEAFDGLIYICSQDYRVEFMNQRLIERTGYDAIGDLCYKALHDRDSICPWCVNERVFAGEVVHWEVLSPKDNRWYYVVDAPIFHPDGSISKQAMITDITERKQAEGVLRENEERYRILYEDNPSMYFTVDAEGTVLSVNRFGAEQLGYTVEELVGQSVLNVFYPDDKVAVQQQLAASLQKPAQVARWEFRKVRKDGSMLWVKEAARAVRQADGKLVVLIVCEDITERKRAEEEIRKLSQFQERIIDNAGTWLDVLDEKANVVIWNKAAEEISGYSREEVVGHDKIWEWLYPDEAYRSQVLREAVAIIEEGGEEREDETTIRCKDGQLKVISWNSQSLVGEKGNPIGSIALGHDVTARKRAEKEQARLLAQIQEQAQRVQQIVDTVPEGVLLLNTDGQVVLANPLGEKDLVALADARVGDPLTHLGGRPLAELLTSPPTGMWHEVVIEGPPRRVFEMIARPLENGSETGGWVLVLRDMTREREVQRCLQQQERLAAVGQLAAGIAHDFNNILTSIIGFATLVRMQPAISQSAGRGLDIVVQQSQRAARLIRQILDFSRESAIEKRSIDLAIFLKETVGLLKHAIPENILVTLQIGPGECLLDADPTRIQQALMNRVINARDAMPEGGDLYIGLERMQVKDKKEAPLPEMEAGEWVRVTVSDNGTGIPSDALPHIFEPFFTTKPAEKGAGLGLAQVWGIVKQHEGHIDVTTKVGEGTTFTLYLPVLQEPPPAPLTQEIAALPQGHGETILVVEDDPVAREALVNSLETLNYRVLAAANGREALAVFEQYVEDNTGSGQGIAVVLSDMVMPEMGGVALLHALRNGGWMGQVIMMTGYRVHEGDDLQSGGVVEWLQKPVSLEQLAQVVARALNP